MVSAAVDGVGMSSSEMLSRKVGRNLEGELGDARFVIMGACVLRFGVVVDFAVEGDVYHGLRGGDTLRSNRLNRCESKLNIFKQSSSVISLFFFNLLVES